MALDTTIQLRIDTSTKNKAQKIFKDLGMDISSVVKLFLNKIVDGKIVLRSDITVNGYTRAQEKSMLRELARTKKYGKRYASAKEAMDDIMS